MHMRTLMKKYIEVDNEAETLLHSICDMALKFGGMQAIAQVNKLVLAIKNEES